MKLNLLAKVAEEGKEIVFISAKIKGLFIVLSEISLNFASVPTKVQSFGLQSLKGAGIRESGTRFFI